MGQQSKTDLWRIFLHVNSSGHLELDMSLTCPQCVKFYSSLFVALENLPHRNSVLNEERSIHESTDGPSNDSDTRRDDIGSYCEC